MLHQSYHKEDSLHRAAILLVPSQLRGLSQSLHPYILSWKPPEMKPLDHTSPQIFRSYLHFPQSLSSRFATGRGQKASM